MLKKGPSLAILSSLRPTSDLPFGGQTEPFLEIINIARKRGWNAFVITPEDIEWDNRSLLGYVPKESGLAWKQVPFPMPTVIYNRLPNRSIEQKDEYREILSKIKQAYGKRFFNPFFLNKWSIYRILASYRFTKNLLPETHKWSIENFRAMLQKYPTLYIKPVDNSLGIGIFRITHEKEQNQIILWDANKNQTAFTHDNLIRAWSDLPFHNSPYLIQKGISLAQVDGRPFDFRVLYQKDKNGQWKKTGFAARIAGEGSITTHVMYGGCRAPGYHLLKQVYGKKNAQLLLNKLSRIGRIVPALIERALKEQFGEMEFDIGIDKKGKIWVFEVNSKPFKFDEPLIRAKSLVRLMHYVNYLVKT
ncbi:YheC/YheD family protein [Thermincola potens]|uniref:ATP-grasp domain-containing protein n=1 Tax=Thermincola potens (strain JR) TaxID=635013 RepID=D5XE94_THEPJ|nr:YheC/YheD family protein [Thermincola potens]ADG81965.1 conserved hypothetical protein [Thermincola potens JR]